MRRYRQNSEEKLYPPLDAFSEGDWAKFEELVRQGDDSTLPMVRPVTVIPYDSLVYDTFTPGMVLAPIWPRVPEDFEPRLGVGPGMPMLWSVFPEALGRGAPGAQAAHDLLPPRQRPSRLVYGTYLDAVGEAERVARRAAKYLQGDSEWKASAALLGWEPDAEQRIVLPLDGQNPPLGIMPATAWAKAESADLYLPRGEPIPIRGQSVIGTPLEYDYETYLQPLYTRDALVMGFDGMVGIPVWPRPVNRYHDSWDNVWLLVTEYNNLEAAHRLHTLLSAMGAIPESCVAQHIGLRYASAYLLRGTEADARRAADTIRHSYEDWLSLCDRRIHQQTSVRRLCAQHSQVVEENADYTARMVLDQLVGLYWVTGGPEPIGPYYHRSEAHESLLEEQSAELESAVAEEDRRPPPAPTRPALKPVRAIVLKPPSRSPKTPPMLLSARSSGDHVYPFSDGKQRGDGYFGGAMGRCERSHTPGGVGEKGAGYGVALYCSLAVEAYQRFRRPCIASAPPNVGYGYRSDQATEWWDRAVQRGLAVETSLCPGCVKADLETFIGSGLVFWMADPGDFEGLVAEARDNYLEAFMSAVPDPDSIELIDEVLSAHASAEAMAEWRKTYHPAALAVTPNRRARARKPSFVTPELEAHVEALYEGLEGL